MADDGDRRQRFAEAVAEGMYEHDNAAQSWGVRIAEIRPHYAVARMTVRDDMLNGFDVLHGGLIFALADTAFAFACNAYDRQAFAASGQIEFLRPARVGDVLTATASEDYRGRRSGYYSIEVREQGGQVVALFHGRSVSNDSSLLK